MTTPGGTGARAASTFLAPPTVSGSLAARRAGRRDGHYQRLGLHRAPAVKVNGTPAQNVSVVSDTQLTAVVASGTTTGPVSVATPGGTTTTSELYYMPAIVRSFTPQSGGLHATVTVTGKNFTGATGVTLGGVHAVCNVVSDTSLTFTIPAGTTGGTIPVTNAVRDRHELGTFSVTPPPTISQPLDPASGPVGTPVTITGTHLGTTMTVEIGNLITVPTNVTSTTVTFAIPPERRRVTSSCSPRTVTSRARTRSRSPARERAQTTRPVRPRRAGRRPRRARVGGARDGAARR